MSTRLILYKGSRQHMQVSSLISQTRSSGHKLIKASNFFHHCPRRERWEGRGKTRSHQLLGRTKERLKGKCSVCNGLGHVKGSAKCELTNNKKRKRKTKAKVGRKKTKGACDAQVTTLRTRAAAAREVVHKHHPKHHKQ